MEFTVPWLVIASAVLGAGTVGVWYWRKSATPALLTLAGAFFLFSGAGPTVGTAGDTQHVVILDASDSMASRFEAVNQQTQLMLKDKKSESNEVNLRYFNDAFHASEVAAGGKTLAQVIPDSTTLEVNGQVVVITDGHIQSDLLPPVGTILVKAPRHSSPDASILAISAPSVLAAGSSTLVTASIRCDVDADVLWVVTGQTGQIAEGTEKVKAGLATNVSASFVVSGSGVQRYRMTLSLKGDREPRNNVAEVAVTVAGKRMIYYAAHKDSSPESDALFSLLHSDPGNAIIHQNALPATSAELEGIHLLVINNVTAGSGSPAQLASIANWVRSGGSLFMVGTAHAFGPGGYRGTAIEDVLPVTLMPDDEPARTVLFALDTSSSMAEGDKLTVLKQAARNLLASLSPSDQVAVGGFSSGFESGLNYSTADNQTTAVDQLKPGGSTDIGRALTQSLDSLKSVQADVEPQRRLILVTDGKDESPDSADFKTLALRCAAENTRLDVILTSQVVPDWLQIMRVYARNFVHYWPGDSDEFSALLETLERAMRGFDRRLVSTTPMDIGGLTTRLHRFVRTAERKSNGADIVNLLKAQTPTTGDPVYPLLSYRRVVGVTAVLTTDSGGHLETSVLWNDQQFVDSVRTVVSELLAGASQPKLELRPDGESWQLHWIGLNEPPAGALEIRDQMTCEPESRGVWSLPKDPVGESILVLLGETLLQRIPLSAPIDIELAYTGNNEPYFTAAERAGFTVFSNFAAWKPTTANDGDKMNIAWLPALLAMICLLSGFALRARK
ncbi:MAG: VWA domain-containing protein [Planctomycetota bacterium]|jgi:Mg-chelatase subunit ChlD